MPTDEGCGVGKGVKRGGVSSQARCTASKEEVFLSSEPLWEAALKLHV